MFIVSIVGLVPVPSRIVAGPATTVPGPATTVRGSATTVPGATTAVPATPTLRLLRLSLGWVATTTLSGGNTGVIVSGTILLMTVHLLQLRG